MPEIGETLREARMRERIDVSEIEAKTKIRAKYLRALENEEWSLLPGPTFVKSSLRTYAQALGLDGKALVEEYRLSQEHPSEASLEPIVSSPQRNRGRSAGGGRSPGGPSRGYIAIVGIVVLLIALLVVGLISKGGGGSSKSPAKQTSAKASAEAKAKAKARDHAGQIAASAPIVALSLRPSAPVYVCLIADKGRKAIAGLELQPGQKTSTYHSRRFLLTLGNSSVTMYVNGRARTVPSSSQAIGYEITKARGRQPLSSGSLPTCK
jgi:cytoskeleton protein RodZ